MKEYLTALSKLKEIALLNEGWNGYGAESFSEEHISHMNTLLWYLYYHRVKEPMVFPTGRKSIRLEWENDKVYIEAEVYEDGHIEVFTDFKNVTGTDLCNWVKSFIDEVSE